MSQMAMNSVWHLSSLLRIRHKVDTPQVYSGLSDLATQL